MMQAPFKRPLIPPVQLFKEIIGKDLFVLDSPLQEKRSHHGYIGKGKQQGTYNTEHQCLCHRSKIFAFNSRQGQYGEKHNQDDENGKSGGTHHTTCTIFHFPVHLFLRQCTPPETTTIDMSQNTFQNNNGAVHYNTKVYCTQTHQIG